jgi:hydroxyethylthiazole kinase-like uncharacterized protein yjeF
MKYVVTAREMAEMDRYSIETLKIPGLILMENAGIGIVRSALAILGRFENKKVAIFCGPGNNGGDGYVVARHLINAGAWVETFILAAREKIRGDALANLVILENMNHQPSFIDKMPVALHHTPDLIIDALLGTGVKGALKGIIAEAVRFINDQSAPILVVDIPTGVDADTGSVDGPAIRASRTATMALLKRGLLLSPGREQAGIVDIVDISMPESVASLKDSKTYFIERPDIGSKLPKRSPDAYKNQCGTAGVLAGSTGFTGAAALTAEAVLRAGAGLCYLMTPEKLNVIYETKLTEVITVPFNDLSSGVFHSANFPDMLPKLQEQDAVAIGPGIGQLEKTAELVHELLSKLSKPMVLDADGLNVCAGQLDLIKKYKGDLVITPHPGELARLAGVKVSNILADRIEFARRFAMEIGKIVVLKGGPSLIAMPDGRLYLNSTGNAGMATAGSGDVLTGLITGLLAQGCPAQDAALAGVFIHGLAGDMAANELGQHGLLAGDILKWTPKAIQSLLEE